MKKSRQHLTLTFSFFLTVLLSACNSNTNTSIYWINSYKTDCEGVAQKKCLLIQKGVTMDDNQWQNFYSEIEGFDFEPGYFYKLKVKEEHLENVPADASSIKYILVEVLEKREDSKFELNGTWEAKKIDGQEIIFNTNSETNIIPQLIIDIKEMQISGTNSCNRFSGMINSIDQNNIQIGPIAATQMMCPDMTIADAFTEAMNKVQKYSLDTKTLILMDANDAELMVLKKAD